MRNSGWLSVFASVLCVFCIWNSVASGQAVMKFDELPFQSIDGLSHNHVTFDFKLGGVDSDDAYFASFGPGDLTTVSDPSMTGNSAGILSLSFEYPTPMLQFGVALNSADSLNPGYTVELFDASMASLGSQSVATTAVGGGIVFSESLFAYSGAPVSKAVIDFSEARGSFAFDNLKYQVPEPGSASMFVVGVLLVIRSWRRIA